MVAPVKAPHGGGSGGVSRDVPLQPGDCIHCIKHGFHRAYHPSKDCPHQKKRLAKLKSPLDPAAFVAVVVPASAPVTVPYVDSAVPRTPAQELHMVQQICALCAFADSYERSLVPPVSSVYPGSSSAAPGPIGHLFSESVPVSDMSLSLADEAAVHVLPAVAAAAPEDALDDELPELVDDSDDEGDDAAGFSIDEHYALFCDFILRFDVPGLRFVHVFVGDPLAVGPDLVVCPPPC